MHAGAVAPELPAHAVERLLRGRGPRVGARALAVRDLRGLGTGGSVASVWNKMRSAQVVQKSLKKSWKFVKIRGKFVKIREKIAKICEKNMKNYETSREKKETTRNIMTDLSKMKTCTVHN